MSVKKFEQFINESVEVNNERLSNNDVINDAYSKLVELSRKSFERSVKKLTLQFNLIERAIKMITEKYGDIIVGNPTIEINPIDKSFRDDLSYGMNCIDIYIDTNIPSIEYDNYQDDYDDFISELNSMFDKEYNMTEYCDMFNDSLYIDDAYFKYNRYDDNEPMKISMVINGIYTTGLVNLCIFNNYDRDKLNKLILKK
jgi:hypothetical protein